MCQRIFVLLVILLFSPAFLCAMTYDNQFFPLGQNLYSRKSEKYSNLMPEGFVVFSDKALGAQGGEMGLFNLYGDYDLNEVARGLEAVGKPNPLRSDWRGSRIPWRMGGRLESIGGVLCANVALSDYWSCGAALLFMNTKTWSEFRLLRDSVNFIAGPGDVAELERDRLQANRELGLERLVSNETGFGDIDAYVRVGKMWHYPRKFRRVDAGARMGVLVPTGVLRHYDNPVSVAFAGNGHWGLYGQVDAEFELKEDVKVGFWVRLGRRFAKTITARVPFDKEPANFGAVVGKFRVNPGLGFLAAPYLLLENLREGFGVGVRYLVFRKYADCWFDCRENESVSVNLEHMSAISSWMSEYVSVDVFYDFGKQTQREEKAPLISFVWDVPVRWLDANRVSKSHRISLGFELSF